MSYYLKYRPQKIGELDLTDVRENLLDVLKNNRLAHAYLFVGPKGSGKTSAARILAMAVNCEGGKSLGEPCGKCKACGEIKKGNEVDVLEMDAASHRGIDDIRNLKEMIKLAPGRLKKKIYIIDEVHMLTKEAFNALLKVLEEPPAHVMFFLCTTEEHKVPETIVSRCSKIVFSKATKDEVAASLMKVVKGEKLKIEKEAVELLAESVDGSFREGHKLLEQLGVRGEKIGKEEIEKVLGLIGGDDVNKLLRLTWEGKTKELGKIFKSLENKGVNAANLLQSLLGCLEEEIRLSIETGEGIKKRLKLAGLLIEASGKLKISPLPFLPIELALLEVGLENKNQPPPPKPPKKEKPAKNGLSFVKIEEEWGKFLEQLSNKNRSIAGLLRSSKPKVVEGDQLTVEVFYEFHKNQLEQETKRALIEKTAGELWGPTVLRCVLAAAPRRVAADIPLPRDEVENDDLIKAAEDVFGN